MHRCILSQKSAADLETSLRDLSTVSSGLEWDVQQLISVELSLHDARDRYSSTDRGLRSVRSHLSAETVRGTELEKLLRNLRVWIRILASEAVCSA